MAVGGATVTARRLDTNVIFAVLTTDDSGGFSTAKGPVPVEFNFAGDSGRRLSFVIVT
jgi:hypothetical protein